MATRKDKKLPARLQVFADPAAEVVWAGLLTLDVALQHQVLRELASKVALSVSATPTTPRKKVESAVAALHEAHDILGGSPSVRAYRELRERCPGLDLPSDSNIRSWLGGGWEQCLRRALLPVPSEGDFAYPAIEHSFTRDELIELALACAEDLQKRPSQGDFTGWVRRPDVAERFLRRPMTNAPYRRFGGWLAVMEEAREVARERGLDSPLLKAIPKRYVYTDSEMTKALVEASDRLREQIGDRSPFMAEYQGERLAIQAESIAAGHPRSLPNPELISERFGGWDKALAAAGLPPLRGPGAQRNPDGDDLGRKAEYTREEKAATLRQAYVEIGDPFVRERFLDWLEGKNAEAAALDGEANLPTIWMIEWEFGGWRRACEEAIPGYVPPRRWQKRPNGE